MKNIIYLAPDIRTTEFELDGFLCVSIDDMNYSVIVDELETEDEEVLAF